MAQEQQVRWRVRALWAAGIAAAIAVLAVAICGYLFEWKWTGFPRKTLWDWLSLLVVPVVLAVVAAVFTRSEGQATRTAAEQRTQDEALQAYLDQMGQMLLDEYRSLRQSKEGEEVRTLARARTLTVLSRLDGERKGTVVRFLYESGLIGRIKSLKSMEKEGCIVDLRDADLSGAVLSGAVLSGAELKGVTLNHADLRGTSLSSADLRGTRLRRANLSGAYLLGTDLRWLDSAAPDTYPPVDRRRNVDLRGANLKKAVMVGVDLTGADLSYANLTGADLVHPRAGPYGILAEYLEVGGNFRGREEGAKVLLQFFAGSWRPATNQSGLRGTILPDGQRYETWLADPETDDVLKRLDEASEKYDPEVWRRRLGGGNIS